MTLYQKLKWFILSGVTETISETPQNRFNAPAKPTDVSTSSAAPTGSLSDSFLAQAQTLASSAQTLTDLYATRASFDGCSLKHSAHTLNGYGVQNPAVLCLMDTPNTEDEKAEKILSGPVGKKYLEMLAGIGLDLAHNTYVSTLIPWRPPGNRKPTDTEFALCRPFWEREISLLKPQVILIFGSAACHQVLGTSSFAKACHSEYTFRDIPAFVCPTAQMVLDDRDNYRPLAWQVLKRIRDHLKQN